MMLKICEKNSSVNLRLEIFVMAFRVRKLFGTFEKRAPGHGHGHRSEYSLLLVHKHLFGHRTWARALAPVVVLGN